MKAILFIFILFFPMLSGAQKKIKSPVVLSSGDTLKIDDIVIVKNGTARDSSYQYVQTTSGFPAPKKCRGYEQNIYYFRYIDETYYAYTIGFKIDVEKALNSGEIMIRGLVEKSVTNSVTKSLKMGLENEEKALQPESIHSSETNEFDLSTIKTQEDSTPDEMQYFYCQIVGTQKMLSSKVTITIDFGQVKKFASDQRLRDDKGEVIVFNSMVDAMNWMGARGWEFIQAYVLTVSNQNVYHWLLKKSTKKMSDEEKKGLLEIFKTKQNFKKKD